MWERTSYWIPTGIFTLFVLWRGRHDFARAWQYRHIFPAGIYWGVAFLYILSGASITFVTFGAAHLGLRLSSTPMQICAVISIGSLGAIYLLARKLATPVFNANDVPQKDRNFVHGLWGMFLLLGWAFGLVPNEATSR